MAELDVIRADWPAPENIVAFSTTRQGGVSRPPYAGLNLATHVGDDRVVVMQNRARLYEQFSIDPPPVWLDQTHGKTVLDLDRCSHEASVDADASVTTQANSICAVLTADCLPLLICDHRGSQVAAVHAGWRGLHAGIISATVNRFVEPAQSLLVWLGPAIGQSAFEVGADVRDAFCQKNPGNRQAFEQIDQEHWWCDIYQLARAELASLGVTAIYGGDHCTFSDAERFYSFRRDGQTGRQASLIWKCA